METKEEQLKGLTFSGNKREPREAPLSIKKHHYWFP